MDILLFIAGFAVGFLIEYLICSTRKDGVIHIFQEEEGDKYLFEFNILPEKIPQMSQVVFKTRIKESNASTDDKLQN